MKAGNITANELLIVGGLLAGAYIIYSAKEAVDTVSNAFKTGLDDLSDAASNGINYVSEAVPNGAAAGVRGVMNGLDAVAKNLDIRGSVPVPGEKTETFKNVSDYAASGIDKVMNLFGANTNNAKTGSTKYTSPTTGNASFAQVASPGYLGVYSDPTLNPTFGGDGLVFTRSAVAPIYD